MGDSVRVPNTFYGNWEYLDPSISFAETEKSRMEYNEKHAVKDNYEEILRIYNNLSNLNIYIMLTRRIS